MNEYLFQDLRLIIVGVSIKILYDLYLEYKSSKKKFSITNK